MLGSLARLSVVVQVPVSLGQRRSLPLKLSESINRKTVACLARYGHGQETTPECWIKSLSM